MVQFIKDECLIINFKENWNGDLLIVFMIAGRGFFKGLLGVGMRHLVGEIKQFHYARISYFDLENGGDTLTISELEMRQPLKESPPAF